MLVLSRHANESIRVGDDVTVTVTEIRGDKVRLGIAAPRELAVHRTEVYEAIQRDREEAERAGTLRHLTWFGVTLIRDDQSETLCTAIIATNPSDATQIARQLAGVDHYPARLATAELIGRHGQKRAHVDADQWLIARWREGAELLRAEVGV